MIETNPDSPLAVMVTNVSIDKHAGEIATGRVYGGTIEKGSEIYFVGSMGKARTQQVGVYFGPERVNTDKVPAGNIVAITGARNAVAVKHNHLLKQNQPSRKHRTHLRTSGNRSRGS
jgi:elongation factor 2